MGGYPLVQGFHGILSWPYDWLGSLDGKLSYMSPPFARTACLSPEVREGGDTALLAEPALRVDGNKMSWGWCW